MRALSRLVAVLGAAAIGFFLFKAAPRDVTLVYDLAAEPGATALEVELRRPDGELVRRAELQVTPGSPVRHAVRLPEGRYTLRWRAALPSGAVQGEKPLEVTEDGTVVLPLSP